MAEVSDEARATSAELKKRQITGGDWYKMDQKPEDVKEGKKFDLDLHSARTQTPLPGQRDADLDATALPSARHMVKDEYSDYVKLAKQGGHQGLLKIDGSASDQNGDRPRSRISDTDSEYVKMAKIGGHANLLKTEGVPAAESPRKNQIKETDSAYIKLAKKGGHTALLSSEVTQAENGMRKNKIKETDSEYIKLAKAGGHSNLLASESTTPKEGSSLPKRKVSGNGKADKIDRNGETSQQVKPTRKAPEVVNDNKPVSTASPRKFKSKSNDWFQHDEKRVLEPITTGKGKGIRKDANNNNGSVILPTTDSQVPKTGKRLFQVQTDRNPPPFALHY
eukprot:Seg150.6 transcript_id=Seg150.6/GoldUCD/mRNA.D3Y31 product="hypothetical protein" protein_id=Seg150.6/GoldUCD/D3Y31